MPCFYLRNQANIALFKLDSETGAPIAELIPSPNLLKTLKEKANLNYSVEKIYEDDQKLESDLISGKKSIEKEAALKSQGDQMVDEDDDDHLDIEDLMQDMVEPINLEKGDNLK
jgi:hypothetical protein